MERRDERSTLCENVTLCEKVTFTGIYSQKLKNKSDEDCAFQHEMVCGFLRQWVDDNVLNHIANDSLGRTLWEKLETLYASKFKNNKLLLLKQAMNLRYKEGNSISNCLSEFQGYFDHLFSMDVKFEDEILGLLLLNTLLILGNFCMLL